ncbi:hypothetical protein HPB49_014303 [Dermacentor silvarum]|uniref:Uncharacterized protein n=1 Tax=Dermacentor silvarum TaxID=543639 RepID=A0ACB8D6G1_DERSI|nr:hypothetical protein HPB49_014303 [Dermacentor silvarum]
MDLEKHISSWLPHLDNEGMQLTVQKLLDCGVQSLEHLKYVVEADLMFLNVASRRILLEKFQTAASPAVQVSIPKGSEASVSLLGQAVDIPWDAFPLELVKACQEGRRPLKSDLNEMIICQMEVGDPAPDDQLEPPPDMDDMFDVPPSPCEEYAPSTNGAQQRGGVTKCARPTCRIEEKNPVRPCDTAEADN